MLVKCIYNKQNDLPEDFVKFKFIAPNDKLNIAIGRELVVYGMVIHYGYVWYLIDEGNFSCPIANPSSAFEILDARLSRYWVFSSTTGSNAENSRNIWAFPEWANDEDYYGALLEGEEREVEIFKKYKKLMDLEFPDTSIKLSATQLDDEWLMCPICIDAWKTTSKDGMVICPMCKQMMHNPAYNGVSVYLC